MMKTILVAVCLLVGHGALAGEPGTATEPGKVEQNAEQFFSIYAERKDFNALLELYDDTATLEDMIYGHYANGKEEIKVFLDWEKGNFRVLGDLPALVVEQQLVDGDTVVATGYFNRFEYYGKEAGPWRFIIRLVFNREVKIIEQTDWINYTPRDEFLGGENRNLIQRDSQIHPG